MSMRRMLSMLSRVLSRSVTRPGSPVCKGYGRPADDPGVRRRRHSLRPRNASRSRVGPTRDVLGAQYKARSSPKDLRDSAEGPGSDVSLDLPPMARAGRIGAAPAAAISQARVSLIDGISMITLVAFTTH